MGLNLLHLSDIHFKNYGNNSVHDLDKNIQREIEFDLEALKAKYGKIDLIIIGGDIAFSGKQIEYEDADTWIKKICHITGCRESDVLSVPGNHDIDRSSMAFMIKDAHAAFRNYHTRAELDNRLFKYLSDPASAKSLLAPFNNYLQFAQKYGSIPNKENELFWEKDFALDGLVLRIRGVNSSLISDDKDDVNQAKLVLGSHQTNIVREEGVIYAAVCHHPPDWLYDGEQTRSDLKARARLQMFGHKHSFGTELVDNKSLILSAGAMQPERDKEGWEPRYNILELSIPTILQEPTLNIRLFKRIWNKTSMKFVADYGDGHTISETFNLPLTQDEITIAIASKKDAEKVIKIEKMADQIIDLGQPNNMRNLVYRFLGLPYHKKIAIAVELSLIEDTDSALDEIQKSQVYLKRVIERNMIPELWDKVTAAVGDNQKMPNPFKK